MSGDRLWMPVKRRGLNHHLLRADAIHTACDLFVGAGRRGNGGRGIVVDSAMAVDLSSKPCRRCWPQTVPRPRPVEVVELPDADAPTEVTS